ncbi:binding-protein-dependent transport systems inner membrane component [Paenibacillus vortex V453]|uniref:Binding-protein-dependent transport systems inner membrane component n=1 Tax=Paenibacillus vortex V453 TaxID=715225 RepID=A0A2R9SQN2_9BACL|nr:MULTISPECIES: ABC transporter permease subunit [Paenibacillus]AWP26694.1 protein lplB [Paenibacillus sp. Cedars]EFU39641.1 binding-protein-dependent transport systems inner membrane component [Paenibacillus vortex V453]MDH6669745.1 putative aldouronate transport system permease protein [Paenibacillus sp. LBL]MPY17028.1 sugar ABC transporter permease [Paenibacillus glucanolyticus]OMF80825.1 protein lplB [Paenibacillus glucanolyticus]
MKPATTLQTRSDINISPPGKRRWAILKQQKYLFLMMLPGLIWAIVFAYTPMVGLYMSFVNYQPTLGGFWSTLFTSEFVGFEWFRYFFNNGDFWIVMRNTLASTLITLLFSFPMPILIAIAINEIKNVKFKKTVQTASYLPYFISWVIAANIIVTLLSSDGAINGILKFFHITNESVLFLQNGKYFWWIVALGNTWKDMGYSSIMYLAAISSINPELYEAAKVDGANRFKQIRFITLPHLKPTIVILLILALGGILNAGFDQHFLLGNDLTRDYSDVLSTYSFRYGIQNGMFSYAAAVGMFSSVVAFIIVVIVNYTAKKLNGQSLF